MRILDKEYVEIVNKYLNGPSNFNDGFFDKLTESFDGDKEGKGFGRAFAFNYVGYIKRRYLAVEISYALVLAFNELDTRHSNEEYKQVLYGIFVSMYFVNWKIFWDVLGFCLSAFYFDDYGRDDYLPSMAGLIEKVKSTDPVPRKLRFITDMGIEDAKSTYRICKAIRDQIVHQYLDPLVFCGIETDGFIGHGRVRPIDDMAEYIKESIEGLTNDTDLYEDLYKEKTKISLKPIRADFDEIDGLVNDSFAEICSTLKRLI